jgi:hypothetical protein
MGERDMGALEMAVAEEMGLVEDLTVAEPGSSWGERTLRPQDLVRNLYEALYDLSAARAERVYDEYPKVMVEVLTLPYHDEPSEGAESAFPHLLDTLFDLMSEHSPPFHYFGSHEGDGSDFGYWFNEEAYQESVAEGDTSVVEWLGDYISVPDGQGGMTIYSTEGMKVMVSI